MENIEKWKLKRLIKSLESMKGNGTSMITLIIPKGGQLSLVSQKLTDEFGTAVNIKSRVNRLSVLSAIKSAQEKIKLYNKTPKNGLVILCGIAMINNKEKMISISLEPFKPMNTNIYLCDNKFHLDSLKNMLTDDDRFGFIIIDGSECLYGAVQGSDCNVLQRFTVDLPKKHNKGGQSAARFGRLRVEKRQNYITIVNEHAVKHFITDNSVNVKGIIIAGSAELKDNLVKAIDKRLIDTIINVIDISKGGINGFHEAINVSSDTMRGVKLIDEKKLLSTFFTEIAKNTNTICYGINDTMNALNDGVIKTLIVWENLETIRHTCIDGSIVYLSPDKQVENIEVISSIPLIDHIVENYSDGELELVSDSSTEGCQFCKGFGGIGGILRYPMELVRDMEVSDGELSENDFM